MYFLKIKKNFQIFFEGHLNITKHFSKIYEDYRLSKIAKGFRGRPEDVLVIQQWI